MSEKAFVSLLAVGALGFATAICVPNALRLRRLRGRAEALRREVEALRVERAGMLRSLSALKRGEKLAWEREVRDRLGWVRPGEIELGDDNPPGVW